MPPSNYDLLAGHQQVHTAPNFHALCTRLKGLYLTSCVHYVALNNTH